MAEKQDIAMNAFKVLTDAVYLYGEATDSSQGKIKKSDLLGALFQERIYDNNANNAINSGSYKVDSSTTNITYWGNGILLVFRAGTFIIQLYFQGTVTAQRRSPDNGVSWGDWKTIKFT